MRRKGAVALGNIVVFGIHQVLLLIALGNTLPQDSSSATEAPASSGQIFSNAGPAAAAGPEGSSSEVQAVATTNAPAAVSNTPPEVLDGVKGVSRRAKEDFQVQLHTNAPPAAGGATNLVAVTNQTFHWDFSWQGWAGLHLEISQRTPLKSPREMLGLQPLSNAPAMHLEQLKMASTIGGLLEVDGAVYRTGGNLDLADDIQLRRARLKAQGDCILVLPVSYKIEIGYIPHKFNLYRLRGRGRLSASYGPRFGHQQP
jgi:hypothetical protein